MRRYVKWQRIHMQNIDTVMNINAIPQLAEGIVADL